MALVNLCSWQEERIKRAAAAWIDALRQARICNLSLE
jgi:hypothetical protein